MTESTAIYAPVGVVLSSVLILLAWGLGFAAEESYPDWPQNPGQRQFPVIVSYAACGESAFLILSIFKRNWRNAAIAGFIAAVALLVLAFVLTVEFNG